ncbi:Uncharacterized protein QTN25_001676 [Entamoeba marina]
MEGCKKDEQKISPKLLQTTVANVEKIIPQINSLYVVSVENRSTSYLASYVTGKKKKEKREKTKTMSRDESLSKILESIGELISSTDSIGKHFESTDLLRTMHVQARNSMITLVVNQQQNLMIILESTILDMKYTFDTEELQTVCQSFFDAIGK